MGRNQNCPNIATTPSSAQSHASEALEVSVETARTIVEVDRIDCCHRISRALRGINLQIPETGHRSRISPAVICVIDQDVHPVIFPQPEWPMNPGDNVDINASDVDVAELLKQVGNLQRAALWHKVKDRPHNRTKNAFGLFGGLGVGGRIKTSAITC